MKRDEIFSAQQRVQSATIQASEASRLSRLNSQDIRLLSTQWSYYSGKIEGNTYTLVETDVLLNDGVTAPHPYSDAVMLKNIYNTFVSELQHIRTGGEKTAIDLTLLMRLHSQITQEVLQSEHRGALRTGRVSITGTSYEPPVAEEEIAEQLIRIFEQQYDYPDPLERGVFLHCNLTRLQPFWDGNKRTARMIEGLVHMQADLIPIFSVEDEQVHYYRNALIRFYEEEDYRPYADFVLRRHLACLHELTPRHTPFRITEEADMALGESWREGIRSGKSLGETHQIRRKPH